jgi:mono/diheme cytochrome c family protein
VKIRHLLLSLVMVGLLLITAGLMRVSAQDQTAEPNNEPMERGEYLANIAGCIGCHTPFQEAYNAPLEQLSEEQLLTLGLRAVDAQDHERMLAGGRPFDLGPTGVLLSANITPDDETGLGEWTDEEIENAIRIGVSRDGRRLHPLMPYRTYYNMAREDMRALIAYLRTVPAVSNDVPLGPSGEGIAPELLPSDTLPEIAPDGSDQVALGDYLVNAVMSCIDCHTPLDAETGAPIMDLHLAGGQPYEGPWGIVYGANITPHPETGLGNWTEQQIMTVLYTGVRIDGRRVVVMPWQDYLFVTESDALAVATYLKQGLEPIDNEVPAPSFTNQQFVQYAENAAQSAAPDNTPTLIAAGIGGLVIVVVGAFLLMRRRKA